ncbi:MAG: arsenate reductase ArsC [Rhodospirillaceae bacterium]|nr:arsenate reductase ArsC [Rhodospirillaceae bacterium]
MADHIRNVLFLCTGNSARSILAESLLDHWGKGLFKGYSAGSFPKGAVHPLAIQLLGQTGLPIQNLRSKSWDEFAQPGAPQMDFIFTVCDQAAGEMCPVWPGHPITAHWGLPDPAAATGTPAERMQAFRAAFQVLETRIRHFLTFPFEGRSRDALQALAAEAGKRDGVP